METEAGFSPAREVKEHLSPAGTEFTACPNAGLPVRPLTLQLQPIHAESSENPDLRGESSQPSASSRLAAALGNQQAVMETEDAELTEARTPRRAVSPEDPSQAEVEAHKLSGHARFRSWCRHCVRGRGCEAPHTRTQAPDSAIPVISWDYCYLSEKQDSTSEPESPTLVMWDSRTKALFAHLIPSKGTDFDDLEAVLKLEAADLDRLGYKRVAFRSDNEPAITSFLRELRRYWSGEVVPEAASTGDPQSNGAAERGVRMIKGAVRTLKDALEYNLSHDTESVPPVECPRGSAGSDSPTIPATSGLMTLLVRYAAVSQRLYCVGTDGRTPYERSTGRRHNPAAAEFGESVWWMPLQTSTNKLPPLGARFEEGFFMGPCDGSAETLVLTSTGLVRCRTIRRKPPRERWSRKLLEMTEASEMQPSLLDRSQKRIGIRAPVVVEPVEKEPEAYSPCPELIAKRPRRQRLERSDFVDHGYTPGCPGCNLISSGRPGEAHHNETCKTRMEPLLLQSDTGRHRVERALQRNTDYTARLSEQSKKPRGGDTSSSTGTTDFSNSVPPGPADPSSTSNSTSTGGRAPPIDNRVSPPRKRATPDPDEDLLMDATAGSSSASRAQAPPLVTKRAADQSVEDLADMPTDDPTARAATKRAADTSVEDLADGMDILSLNVGSAFEVTAQGSIAEIYSPPRIVPHAEKAGFMPGWSLDLTVKDEGGQPYDFSKHECREKARKLIHKTKPLLLIGSPMCTWFSVLQNLNKKHMSKENWQKAYNNAVEHIKFVFELYDTQVRNGRYFLHEHPATATSWKLPVVTQFCARYPHLYAVTMNMCQFGMTTPNSRGEPTPVKKPTRWLTNSPCLADSLEKHCPGDHVHEPLLGGKAKAAQEYPPKLCAQIVSGFAAQLKLDLASVGVEMIEVSSKSPTPVFNLEILQVDSEDTVCLELNQAEPTVKDEDSQWEAEDDVHGGTLPASLVMAARQKETKYLKDRKVYSYATVAEAWHRTRKKPLKLKWIDTNKGDKRLFNVRSRLVCTEIRRKGTESIFSATPPLESLRILLAKAASEDPSSSTSTTSIGGRPRRDPYKILLVDVSRAHFYADAVRDVYIQLPEEDPRSNEAGICGKLEKTMYGTLDAAERWGEHYALTLTNAGFTRGTASPCHFYHADKDIWILVHGDDFVVVARQSGREYAETTLRAQYEVKVDMAGPEAQDPKEIKILGRIVTYTDQGLTYEPDPGNMEKVIHELKLSDGKGAATPGVKDDSTVTAVELLERRKCYPPSNGVFPTQPVHSKEEGGWPELTGTEHSQYQSLAASLNYFALDRLDIMFAVKELMRKLSSPDENDWQKLKRAARYLINTPRLVMQFPWQPLGDTLTVYTDADHAGCLRTRKSTSGGVIVWNKALLKAWSRTQSLIALSSGESELAAVTKAAAEALGIKSVLSDFGTKVKIEIHSDATAAIGICKE